MNYVNLEKLIKTEASPSPFPYMVCNGFIPADQLENIHNDFPSVPGAGSFPLSSLSIGRSFGDFIESLRSEEVAKILAEKLKAPIVGRPTMVTVRGFCRETDGKIHLDSGGKIVTVLLYLNRHWQEKTGGRLRLLKNGEDINNYFMEIPPEDGLLLAFRCDDNAWHGHLPFAGERRVIQLNWVVSRSYQRRESVRHLLSATVKKIRMAMGKRGSK